MDALNPWLDPAEVRHLAEQLLRPVAPAHLAAADPGFDSSFIGFTQPDAAVINPSVDSTRPETTAKPFLPAENPKPSENPANPIPPPPAAPSRTRFLERIHIFRDWLAKNFRASDIFILDREGKVIFDESEHGRLHFMARNLALAARSPGSQSGNVHVKIGPAAILEVIPCETPYGRIVLGTLVPAPFPPQHIQTIIEVLIQTASPV